MKTATNLTDGRNARARTTVLITGFGPFPGVPVNATMRLVPELAERAARLFAGVRFATAILPTEWLAAPQRLDQLLTEVRPDLALHFGVSGRARGFEIETRACNRRAVSPDASGGLPPAAASSEGGAAHVGAGLPAQYLVARLRRRGIAAFVSRDAGEYLCNATLYHSVCCAREVPGRRVGFIHVPATLARPGGENRGRSGACALTWVQAVDGGLEILAACLGRRGTLRRPRRGNRDVLQAGAPGRNDRKIG
jgi:pyroglutamyl-peptidase